MFLLQFNHGYTALALTITTQPEAFDHPVSAQMFVDCSAQSSGAVAMDQVHHCLPIQNGAIDISIHLRQSFIHSQAQQIQLHFGRTLYTLYPAVGPVCIACQAGIALLCLGLG